jgi:hypothetical protein
MPFSVGEGGAALDDGEVVVVVVVVVVVEGACPPLFVHALANAPIAISAEQPAAAIRRRLTLSLVTIDALFCSVVSVHAGWFGGRGRRLDVRREQVSAGGVDALLRWRWRRGTR